MSDFGRLRSYELFLIPVHALVWTASNSCCVMYSHYGCHWRHKKQWQTARCYSRGSQPSGSPCCGRRWHFRKPALSTDKFKLKVTSRSQLYIYTLNVSRIMLVYYFVPFIVSNRYLLFWVSNGHNSVTVQNRTHIYMNFFCHKDLGNHLLQLCPKVVKHPVYYKMIHGP